VPENGVNIPSRLFDKASIKSPDLSGSKNFQVGKHFTMLQRLQTNSTRIKALLLKVFLEISINIFICLLICSLSHK
jgi:hypothetical protein